MKITKLIKNSPIIAGMYYSFRRLRHSMIFRSYRRTTKIQKDMILLNNFNGRGYGDNPKAIAEAFHALYPKIRLVWAYRRESDRLSLPEYIEGVRFRTPEYFRSMAEAKVWIFNVIPPGGTKKRKGQIYVQTWHGDRPLKKILKDAAADSPKYRRTSERVDSEQNMCDYFISGSAWFSRAWRRATGYTGEILEYGMPRNDCLVNYEDPLNQERVRVFKERYQIDPDAMVLLYAPTFRDHSLNDEAIDNQLDLNEIMEHLKEKYQKEWICLVRGHRGVRLVVNGNEQNYVDVTSYPDMSDILMTSDMLITDYSSCAGDYALLHRPIILYQEDFKDYTEKDRTLYFRMHETPYLICHDMAGIHNLIDSLTDSLVHNNCEEILSLYEVNETGHSAETVCHIIRKQMEVADESE